MLIGTSEVTFKLDTGAGVTAVSERVHQSLHPTTPLLKPTKVLYGPDRKQLQVLGQFTHTISHDKKTSEQQIFVVKGLRTNLLGLPAITALKLAARLDSVDDYRAKVLAAYPDVFTGLGNLGEPYKIELKPDARPHAIYTPRRVPYPIRDKVKRELEQMEAIGVITKVEKPSPWCAGMVAVPKKSGDVRICVDLKPLNESVLREIHPLPKVDDVLAQLSGATVFSKLDANSGFWQIPLDPSSRDLTTFLTPFGRYHFNKMPFGISSAPEHFQKRMGKMLAGLEGVVCLMDDVLVFAQDVKEHDARLDAVLHRIKSSGATLNAEKCQFRQTKIKFLGHVLDERGISADPDKTAAIRALHPPKTVSELRRFMGMVNQLGKFLPNLADTTQPLRALLSSRNSWTWGPDQQKAFDHVKAELSNPTVLALYSPDAETKISADSSSYGLGAVLLQKNKDAWRPVAYASRSLSETETRYAQIEKEALAGTWACEKFSDYILGKRICLETDHKPLVSLLGSKHLDSLPPRILRFRLRLSRFLYDIQHIPGKLLYTADTLSRDPDTSESSEAESSSKDVDRFVEAIVSAIPASEEQVSHYQTAQEQDSICAKVLLYCREGWPDKEKVTPELQPYWGAKHKITVVNNILLHGSRIVVPLSLQEQTLKKIHEGHLGVQKCLLRARVSVWWPGITTRIKNLIYQCRKCVEHSTQPREPLIPSQLPTYPWQKVGADLFELKGANYLLVVDYYSRYPELVKLTSTTSPSIVKALKGIFARHGIPEVLRSDNGPQFDSEAMTAFASEYEFSHTTSSPRYPQSNGLVERSIKTIKQLLKKSDDPFLALLVYRTSPLQWCGYSPSELLMGRRLRTTLPQVQELLIPKWSYLSEFRLKDKQHKDLQKENYDKCHRVAPLPELPDGTPVLAQTGDTRTPATVVKPTDAPRSYLVQTDAGSTLRRNRHQLVTLPTTPSLVDPPEPKKKFVRTSPIITRSRTQAKGRGDVETPCLDRTKPVLS